MAKPQFSLRWLLAMVTFVAAGSAAVAYAPLDGLLRLPNLIILGLLLASSLAIARTGRSRAFWGGFAVWGWAFIYLQLQAFDNTNSAVRHVGGHRWVEFFGPPAVPATNALLQHVAMKVVPFMPKRPSLFVPDDANYEIFFMLAWSACALLTAFIGGIVTRAFYREPSTKQP